MSEPPTSPTSQQSGGTTLSVSINTEYANAIRFPAWMALCVFSIICMISLESYKDTFDVDDAGETWVLSVTIISFILSFIAVAAYLFFRTLFVGQLAEVILTAVLIAFWAAGLPTIMNPSNAIAVAKPVNDEIGATVLNANLYFFSWLAFAACIFLSASLLQEQMGLDVRSTPVKSARWYGLTVSSLVVMSTAVRTYRASDCRNDDDNPGFCGRSVFAIVVGVLGFFMAGGMAYLVQIGLTLLAETVITTVQLILWCFGVGYITFGSSPGATIGNLYFSTWISFLLTVFLFAQCFREFVAGREQAAAAMSPAASEMREAGPDEEFEDAGI